MLNGRVTRLLAGLLPLLLASAEVGAQARRMHSLRVVVVDTAGTPLANAQVSVLSGLNTSVATGMTDSAGLRTLAIAADGELQLVVRRIGSRRSSQFFTPTTGVQTIRVSLIPLVTALAEVRVIARADPKRASCHVDADDIAESGRPILDALDIVTKLRPDMFGPARPRRSIPVSHGMSG